MSGFGEEERLQLLDEAELVVLHNLAVEGGVADDFGRRRSEFGGYGFVGFLVSQSWGDAGSDRK